MRNRDRESMSSDQIIGFDSFFIQLPFSAVEAVADVPDIRRLYPEIIVVILPADAPEITRPAGPERTYAYV